MEFQGREEPEGRPGGPGDLKSPGGTPLALLLLPGRPSLLSGSSLASLELHQTSLEDP